MDGSACSCGTEATLASTTAQAVERVLDLRRQQVRRPEAACHAADYLRGLLADIDRKNGWQLAEHAGYAHPRGMQRVLDRYVWDADAVRDDLRAYVAAALGDPTGILVVDETGFPKQGAHSAGGARQYCGTLGKIGNCQVGVFLGYAGPHGHAAIDRALYVPRPWLEDPNRCRQAGMPSDLAFQTKPQLAWAMLERALAAGVPAAWVVADEVYGSDGVLRRALEARDQAYVLAVRGNQSLSTWLPYGPPTSTTVADIGGAVAPATWVRLSCGEGAQGPRLYDWASVPLRPALREGWVHGLLIRRASTTWPIPWSTPPPTHLWTTWSGRRARAGRSRRSSSSPRARSDSITTRSGVGRAGTGISPSRCSPWPRWPQRQKKGEPRVPTISRSPSPNSGVSSSAASGARPTPRTGSVPGRAGDATISGSPSSPTAVAA